MSDAQKRKISETLECAKKAKCVPAPETLPKIAPAPQASSLLPLVPAEQQLYNELEDFISDFENDPMMTAPAIFTPRENTNFQIVNAVQQQPRAPQAAPFNFGQGCSVVFNNCRFV